MKTFRITIIEQDQVKLFQEEESGQLFDRLEAYDVFEGGNLKIERNGIAIAETQTIEEYGTHAACTCFIGLNEEFGYVSSALSASEFQVNDILTLTLPNAAENASLAKYLQESWLRNKALSQVMTAHPEGIAGTPDKNVFVVIREKMKKRLKRIVLPEILIF